MKLAIGDLICAVAGLAIMGLGLWWKDPGTSLAVVGGCLFIVSVFAQFAKRRTPPDA